MLVIWNERARPLRERFGDERGVMSSPAKRMRPASGRRLPASWLISVVLPAPLGPMTASVSPSCTSRSTLSEARSAPKFLRKPSTLRRTLVMFQKTGQAALEKNHRQHEQRPEDHLPVLRPRGKQVLEQEQRKAAEQRA